MVLELFALDGRALHYLWLSLAPLRPGASRPALLDTVAAMTFNGMILYGIASAPFAMLHPLGYLIRTGEYSTLCLDWVYAAFAAGFLLDRRARRTNGPR